MRTYEFKVPGTNETALIEAESFDEALKKIQRTTKRIKIIMSENRYPVYPEPTGEDRPELPYSEV